MLWISAYITINPLRQTTVVYYIICYNKLDRISPKFGDDGDGGAGVTRFDELNWPGMTNGAASAKWWDMMGGVCPQKGEEFAAQKGNATTRTGSREILPSPRPHI
jgi:hypothetical protein